MTSDEKKESYYEEGSTYTLKEPVKKGKTFVGWYNSSDNKYYNPYDKINIDYGMYFEAVWN